MFVTADEYEWNGVWIVNDRETQGNVVVMTMFWGGYDTGKLENEHFI